MSSGSIQLAAQGMQDVYLNGKPDVSYFASIFRRHSPFLLQSLEYPFDTPTLFGGLAKARIPYRGDLLRGISLKVTLPPLYQPSNGWVYPIPTSAAVTPWVTDPNALSQIRINLPSFKTYFSDGANTITYINRNVSYYSTNSPYQGNLQPIRLIALQATNASTILPAVTVTSGLPYTGIITVVGAYGIQTFSSNGVTFSYYTIDVSLSTAQIISPITTLTSVTFSSGSTAKVLSAASLPWIRNDTMFVTYDPLKNGFVWKSLYSLIKPMTTVNINISNVAPITDATTITGIGSITGPVQFDKNTYTTTLMTPLAISVPEYINIPPTGNVAISLFFNDSQFATGNVGSVQYPSQLNFSNVNMSMVNYKFESGLDFKNLNDPSTNWGKSKNIVVGSDGTIYTTFEDDLTGDGIIPVLIKLNLSELCIANASINNATTIISTNFPPSAVISNVTILPNTLVKGLPVKSTVKTVSNTFTSNTVNITFSSQSFLPITSSANVSFMNGLSVVSTGAVSYSYFSSVVTISKLAFPTSQSCVFWGFDPGSANFTGAR